MHDAQMMRRQGMKISQIAEALGKCERTIHNYLSQPSRPRKKREYSSKLDPYKPYIDTILEDDPSFNREVLLRNLIKQKYEGGITILRDYAAQKAEEVTTKAVIRFETEPGYQAQVDWKILGKRMVDGRLQKLYAFVMVFGYSRAPFVLHTTSMDQATLLMCHVLAFMYFGGVPSEILYDNMKTAFVYSAADEKWVANKHLLSLARHYGFTPRRCRVRRPQTKGKVERFIHYYENNFWVEWRGQDVSLDALNESVLSWISRISDKSIQGIGESRAERFAHEKAYLIPLPKHAFDCRRPEPLKVSRESLVRIHGNWYSVPPEYIGKQLTLKVDPLTGQAEISYGSSVVQTLTVLRDAKNQRYYLPEHQEALKALWLKQLLQPSKPRHGKASTEVTVRSPADYDKFFEHTGVPV